MQKTDNTANSTLPPPPEKPRQKPKPELNFSERVAEDEPFAWFKFETTSPEQK